MTARYTLTLFALGLAVSAGGPAPVGAAPAGAQVRLLSDGGFERGAGGWKLARQHRLVRDPEQARSGGVVLLGEVSARGQGQPMKRTFTLRRDRLYRLVVWARSTSGSRLTVWRRTAGQRHVVATWSAVPKGWKRHQIVFTVEEDGPTTLGIVAPSSHSANPGRMWLDDLALYEQPQWPATALDAGEGFADQPVAAPAEDGAWLAWTSFRDGHDTLQAARVVAGAEGAQVAARFPVVDAPGTSILDPFLIQDGRGGAVLLWSSEEGGDWELLAARIGSGGASPPVRIAAATGADANPVAAWHAGALWVAWVSTRGGERGIWASPLDEDLAASAPVRVSVPGQESLAPTLAGLPGGPLWIAWHAWEAGSTDLYAANLGDRTWSAPRRLTKAPAIDREPRLAAAGGTLWLAWEHVTYKGYRIGESRTKRVELARLGADFSLRMPSGLRRSGLSVGAEAPELLGAPDGSVQLAVRTPRGPHAGWDVHLWRFGRGLAGPLHLSQQKGFPRRPALVDLGSQVLAVYQADDLSDWFASVEASETGRSGVVGTLVSKGALGGGALRRGEGLEPYRSPSNKHPPQRLRKARDEDRRGWAIEAGGRRYQLFFGDLHEHSDLSRCHRSVDETQDQSWQMMRNVAAYDFGALTDHGYNFNAYLWNLQAKRVRLWRDPGFLPLLGQEWTSTFETPTPEHPYGHYGHRNLIYADPYVDRWYNATDGMTPAQVWADLRGRNVSFVHIPHQLADRGNVPVDWSFVDEVAQPVAEIHQIRGSYECFDCPGKARLTTPAGWFLQDAWAKGLILGVVAAPEHQGGAGLAAVYAEALEGEAILDGMRARRTYGTTGPKILLDVRVDGHLMGTVAEAAAGPVAIEVRARGTAPIRTVEILRNNVVFARRELRGPEVELSVTDPSPPAGAAWYYVRLTQDDGHMAWSSPVWLGRL